MQRKTPNPVNKPLELQEALVSMIQQHKRVLQKLL